MYEDLFKRVKSIIEGNRKENLENLWTSLPSLGDAKNMWNVSRKRLVFSDKIERVLVSKFYRVARKNTLK